MDDVNKKFKEQDEKILKNQSGLKQLESDIDRDMKKMMFDKYDNTKGVELEKLLDKLKEDLYLTKKDLETSIIQIEDDLEQLMTDKIRPLEEENRH